MEWNRSETLALASHFCTRCHGVGLLHTRRNDPVPCGCVSRRIFRTCFARFREIALRQCEFGVVSKHICSGPNRRVTYCMKSEEYVADFTLIAGRLLTLEQHKVFRYHFLLGADWKLCCRKLQIDRGLFFHAVYRIEAKLGRAFRELTPFPLFPVNDYFAGAHVEIVPAPAPNVEILKPKPLRPPVLIPIRPPVPVPVQKAA